METHLKREAAKSYYVVGGQDCKSIAVERHQATPDRVLEIINSAKTLQTISK